jgi:hypothetical protein
MIKSEDEKSLLKLLFTNIFKSTYFDNTLTKTEE